MGFVEGLAEHERLVLNLLDLLLQHRLGEALFDVFRAVQVLFFSVLLLLRLRVVLVD